MADYLVSRQLKNKRKKLISFLIHRCNTRQVPKYVSSLEVQPISLIDYTKTNMHLKWYLDKTILFKWNELQDPRFLLSVHETYFR